MGEERKESYITKLLVMLLRRSNGEIRVAAADLMQDDVNTGVQVHFDYSTKELVLTIIPAGAKTYYVKENQSWLSTTLPTVQRDKAPLSQDELVAKAWTESASRPKVVTLTTEGMADAEIEKRKQQVLREIEAYQSPQPPSRPTRSQPLATFFKS